MACCPLLGSEESYPNMMLDWPPGGAWRRVEERSLRTLPQFWLAPLANLLEDSWMAPMLATPPACCCCWTGAACWAGAACCWAGATYWRTPPRPPVGAGASPPKVRPQPKEEAPPGGAWRRVVERSVRTLPQFWLAPLEKALEDMVVVLRS